MRIGVYDPYLDDLGGGEKYMLKICECLSKKHDVSLFWDDHNDLEKANKRFGLDLSKISLAPNIFSAKTPFLKKIIETRKYDAIIFLSDGSIPLSLSKKLFLHIQQPLKGIPGGIRRNLKMKRVARIFSNSAYTKHYVDKALGSDALIIYPPVILKPKNLKKENIILHVGRFRIKEVMTGISDYKKQFFMVEAFKKMAKEIPGWKFTLAVSVREGEEGEFAKLEEGAKGFPIEFLLNRSNDELWDIYSKAKIYWHASGFGEDLEANPELAEHFGISTVEAMGAGAVPVVINGGGQKEIVEDGKTGFLWDNLDMLKEQTITLTKNPDLLGKLSKSARERANFFAGDRFCREINEMVEK